MFCIHTKFCLTLLQKMTSYNKHSPYHSSLYSNINKTVEKRTSLQLAVLIYFYWRIYLFRWWCIWSTEGRIPVHNLFLYTDSRSSSKGRNEVGYSRLYRWPLKQNQDLITFYSSCILINFFIKGFAKAFYMDWELYWKIVNYLQYP